MQDAKIAKNSPSGHNCTTLSGCIFATKAHINNRKKFVQQQCLPHTSSQYDAFGPLAAEIVSLVWAPLQIQRVSRLGSITARHSSSERQANFAALNRGRHLYSAGRPSRWVLVHILVLVLHFSLPIVGDFYWLCYCPTFSWQPIQIQIQTFSQLESRITWYNERKLLKATSNAHNKYGGANTVSYTHLTLPTIYSV